VYYEEIFVNNNNQTYASLAAFCEVMSESPSLPGSATLDMALAKALNDTGTCANRQTLPTNGDSSALTWVTQPAAINIIANSGNLSASSGAGNAASAQKIFLRLTLPAGTTAYKGSATIRTQGGST